MALGFASALPLGTDAMRWFVPTEQPVRRSFGVAHIAIDRAPVEVRRRELAARPFCVLSEFHTARPNRKRVLLVAPLSGHFPFILRELVVGLLGTADVTVTDWLNARFVPVTAGHFGFDENIECIVEAIKQLGPGAHVVALCQGVIPALAAAAILARDDPARAPASLTLMGGPVDPLANPTRVVRLLRQRSLLSIEAEALDRVAPAYPGAGRLVYPARYQLSALLAYFYRHLISGGELLQKLLADDGLDPVRFPFFGLFTSLMDLPARYFLENIEKVFLMREAWTGELAWRGAPVDFSAIRNTALMTIEGTEDDIAAPGQTSAAHDLCANIPARSRRRLVLNGAGHFSLFYGRACREKVLPQIIDFLQSAGSGHALSAPEEQPLHDWADEALMWHTRGPV